MAALYVLNETSVDILHWLFVNKSFNFDSQPIECVYFCGMPKNLLVILQTFSCFGVAFLFLSLRRHERLCLSLFV